MSVMALDIETKNMSYDIGGFGNTHMFQVSTVATWDGNTGTVYVDEPVDSFAKSGHIVKSLRELKYDLDEHFQKGGVLLGHNIAAFDLPILKDSMDIYCIKQYLEDKRYIDTSRILTKEHGERFPLSNLVKCTMNDFKLMDSADAPKLWKAGQYDEVVEYCMKDTQLVYDLWKYGQDNGIVKAFSVDKEKFVELEVKW
jgi:DNA polymerase elongation subunit (family B)|tara:strand:+ start:457 stop:1050 length:594 start_codon:yes stop_codon:yes gene_type:complete